MKSTTVPAARCRLNVDAWLREMGRLTAPILLDPPLDPTPQRCFLEWSFELQQFFAVRMNYWKIKIKDHKPLGMESAIRGWRERRGRWAAQVVEHNSTDHGRFFEIDFDASNPDWGAALTLAHVLFDWAYQKLTRHGTDPFRVAKARGWTNGTESVEV